VKKLDLPKASDNPIAKLYLEKRLLNPEKFYFADKFQEWTNTQKPTFSRIVRDESRIVIPLYTREGELFGFQGRALGPSKVKYITIILNEEYPKVYGLDRVNTEQTVYVTEGPFDSTFVQNAIAMCGSDISINGLDLGDDIVYVLDNEPRNVEICEKISKLIDRGEKVIIWPKAICEKDINDMVISGHSIMNVLKSNTYKGLEAKLKFTEWKRYEQRNKSY
jgi:hypothetical protein